MHLIITDLKSDQSRQQSPRAVLAQEKNPLVTCGVFAKCRERQILESKNWFWTDKMCFILAVMFSCVQSVKTLPGMHWDHIL